MKTRKNPLCLKKKYGSWKSEHLNKFLLLIKEETVYAWVVKIWTLKKFWVLHYGMKFIIQSLIDLSLMICEVLQWNYLGSKEFSNIPAAWIQLATWLMTLRDTSSAFHFPILYKHWVISQCPCEILSCSFSIWLTEPRRLNDLLKGHNGSQRHQMLRTMELPDPTPHSRLLNRIPLLYH